MILNKTEITDKQGQYNYHFEDMLIENSAKRLLTNLAGKNVLELGCGKGIVTKILREAEVEVSVVEESEHFIEKVKSMVSGVRFEYENWLEFDFRKEQYSDVVIFRGFDLLEDPIKLLIKLKNELQGSPRIHVVITNTKSLHRLVGEKMSIDSVTESTNRSTQVGRVQSFNLDSLVSMLVNTGLEIEQKEGIGLKPLSNDMLENLDDKLLKAYADMGDLYLDNAAEIYVQAKFK